MRVHTERPGRTSVPSRCYRSGHGWGWSAGWSGPPALRGGGGHGGQGCGLSLSPVGGALVAPVLPHGGPEQRAHDRWILCGHRTLRATSGLSLVHSAGAEPSREQRRGGGGWGRLLSSTSAACSWHCRQPPHMHTVQQMQHHLQKQWQNVHCHGKYFSCCRTHDFHWPGPGRHMHGWRVTGLDLADICMGGGTSAWGSQRPTVCAHTCREPRGKAELGPGICALYCHSRSSAAL